MVLFQNTKDKAKYNVVRGICKMGRDINQHCYQWLLVRQLIKSIKEHCLTEFQIYEKKGNQRIREFLKVRRLLKSKNLNLVIEKIT